MFQTSVLKIIAGVVAIGIGLLLASLLTIDIWKILSLVILCGGGLVVIITEFFSVTGGGGERGR